MTNQMENSGKGRDVFVMLLLPSGSIRDMPASPCRFSAAAVLAALPGCQLLPSAAARWSWKGLECTKLWRDPVINRGKKC